MRWHAIKSKRIFNTKYHPNNYLCYHDDLMTQTLKFFEVNVVKMLFMFDIMPQRYLTHIGLLID